MIGKQDAAAAASWVQGKPIMIIRYRRLSLAIALVSAAASGQAVAGAFQLQEQSVSGQGTSWAGRSSNVQDGSIVFGNPAGMSFLDRAQVTAGTHYIDASSDISNDSGTQPALTPGGVAVVGTQGSSDGDMIPHKAVPFGYYVQPINDRWSFGLGVYAPFGLVTDYSDDFKGRYFGNYSDLEIITAQPTLSYRFNDKFAIGFGVTYNHIKGELESKSPNPLNPTAAGDGTVNVKGDDDAWGYNIGMIYRPVESTTLGLTYRSKVEYHLTGDVDASNVFGGVGAGGPVFLNADGDASLDITLPETIDFSVTHQLDDRWTVMAGATYIRWSRFDQLVVDNDLGLDINEQQDYRDTWQYAAGLAYQLNPAWTLRGGIAYDQSPVKDAHRSPRVPTADRTLVSIGAGWTPIPDLTIDAAYSYIWEDRADVDLQDENGNSYQAEYDNSLNLFGVQATYRF